MNSGRCTISDIAREVGVSATTVSRYLNGKYRNMSEDTRERIRLAIERNQYRPSLLARGMKTDQSYLIGVILPQVTTKPSSHTVRGVCAACIGTDYSPLCVSIENGHYSEHSAIENLLDHHVDGIISYTGLSLPEYHLVQENGTPVVLADRYFKDEKADVVTMNHYEAVQEAMLHLYLSGFRRIAVFIDPITISRSSTIRMRLRAFNEFIRPDLEQQVIYVTEQDEKDMCVQIRSFVESDHVPKAAFAFSMNMFESMHWQTLLMGYRYPEDLGLLGYCLKDSTFYDSENVTSLQQPILTMAHVSVQTLIHRISFPHIIEPTVTTLPITLHVGKSTLLNGK